MFLEETAIYVGGRSCHRYSQEKYSLPAISLKLLARIKSPSKSMQSPRIGIAHIKPWHPRMEVYDRIAGAGAGAGDQTVNNACSFILKTDGDFFKFRELLLQNLHLTNFKHAPMRSPSSSLLTGNETEIKRHSSCWLQAFQIPWQPVSSQCLSHGRDNVCEEKQNCRFSNVKIWFMPK